MRESITDSSRPHPNTRVLWSGAILLTIGHSLVLLAAEWFADFDACLANRFCTPPDAVTMLFEMLGLLVVGVGMSVGAAILLLVGWLGPACSTYLRTPSS